MYIERYNLLYILAFILSLYFCNYYNPNNKKEYYFSNSTNPCFLITYTKNLPVFIEAINSIFYYLSPKYKVFLSDINEVADTNCIVILTDTCNYLATVNKDKDKLLPDYMNKYRGDVIYNFEPIASINKSHGIGTACLKEWHFIEAINGYNEWDYSKDNVRYLQTKNINTDLQFKNNINSIDYVPLTFINRLDHYWLKLFGINTHIDKYDVVFFGTTSHRRDRIINELRNKYKIQVFGYRDEYSNMFGIERDKILARAKIILNIHYSNISSFEFVRVFGPLINQKMIISETVSDSELMTTFKEGIIFSKYSQIAQTVNDYLTIPRFKKQRNIIGRKGYKIFKSVYNASKIIQPVLDKVLKRYYNYIS